jgi:hypothetical protein
MLSLSSSFLLNVVYQLVYKFFGELLKHIDRTVNYLITTIVNMSYTIELLGRGVSECFTALKKE